MPCLAIGLAVGIALAEYAKSLSWVFVGITIVLALATRRLWPSSLLIPTLAAIALGVVRVAAIADPPPIPLGHVVLAGTVDSPPRARGNRWTWELSSGPRRFLVSQRSPRAPAWGQHVRVRGIISFPEAPTNPGQFDYRHWLARRGIRQTIQADSAPTLLHRPMPTWQNIAIRLRSTVQEQCDMHLPSPRSALASGMLLSLTDSIPFELREAFETTGTVHLLSTSGFHLAVLASVLGYGLDYLPLGTRTLALVGVCWLIAGASGGGAAPVRSATMATITALAPVLRRRSDGWITLCTAAFIALVVNPNTLFDMGAQLSFATVGALILASPAIETTFDVANPWNGAWTRLAKIAAASLAVSIIAHAASAPLVVQHMYRFQPWAALVNVPAAILGSTCLANGLFALLLGAIPILGPLLWGLLDMQLMAVEWLVTRGAQLPSADLSVSPWGTAPTLLCHGILFCILAFWAHWSNARKEIKG